MKSHDEIRELLIPFVLGQLSEKGASDITRHLVECQECGGEVKRLGTILECARQTQDLTAGEQLSKSAKETILAAAQETEKTRPRPTISMQNVWRIIMKSRITKFAAAAVIIIALYVLLQIPSGLLPTAYALEDTIEAYNSIRWLHIYESATVFEEIRRSEIWLGCDEQGNVTRMRFQSDNVGDPIGSLIIAGDSDSSEAWLARHNLRLVGYGDPSVLLRYDVSELDPKFLFERLFEQEKRGEVIVDVNEPMEKAEPIVVTVTYPEGSKSETWKKVFYIAQATKLVLKVDKLGLRSKGFERIKTLEFFDYNRPIDPMMFTLDGEVPADVKVVDMSEVEIGLSQGNMTDRQIAEQVTREFFEAVIAKDFYRAGQLYLGAPDFLVERAFMGANALKIISVGPGHRDTDPDSNAMNCSCRVLVEFGGQHYVLNAWMVRIIRADRDTNRWLISGTAINTRPAGGLTLSRDGADLNAVIYDGLARDQFMKKWLILEPIRIEANGDSNAPSEQTQEDAFVADQVDVSNFQAKVNVSGKDHEWLLLEHKYGVIDLTDEFGESSMITYAWAQIEMPEEKEVVLGIGSDDGVKVWLNGELVHEYWVCRGVGVDNDRIPFKFKKGMNQLVLKVQNQGGPWGFCCRLLDARRN
ncbi:MAG: hypothetical protein ACYS83_11545 [Planctomycetota bacterium]|jgi:hypothetical protein